MIVFLLAMAQIVGAAAIDLEMTSQEKRSTGLYKLSEKEKTGLQSWIDTHYEKRSAPVIAEGVGQTSMLQENLQNGHYIRLANGTLWNIHPSDTPVAQGWITPVDITVSQSGDPNYPYKLTNTLTGSALRAKKVNALPAKTPAPAPQK